MSEKINEIEQRLFMLLDTVEKQAEENEKQARENDQIRQQISDVVKKLDGKIDTLTDDADKKVDVTQKRFDNLVYLSTKNVIEENLPDALEQVITEQVNFKPVEDALENAVQSLNDQINGNSSTYKAIQKYNLAQMKEMADALAYQKKSVTTKHYKILAIVATGIFIIFSLFFWIMYAVTVPTQEHLESLKREKIQLMTDINQLKINRTKWLQDAKNNGYL